jgi:hypothetical protein
VNSNSQSELEFFIFRRGFSCCGGKPPGQEGKRKKEKGKMSPSASQLRIAVLHFSFFLFHSFWGISSTHNEEGKRKNDDA